MSTYTIVRAAINSLDVGEECSDLFMCEGGVELRKYGEFGRLLVELGGELLGERRKTWLGRGLNEGMCGKVFEGCREIPYHYRHPGVMEKGHYRHHDLLKLMMKIFKENIYI